MLNLFLGASAVSAIDSHQIVSYGRPGPGPKACLKCGSFWCKGNCEKNNNVPKPIVCENCGGSHQTKDCKIKN